MQIFKYQVEIMSEFKLNLPLGAKFLKAEMQGDFPTMWLMVNTHRAMEQRTFKVIGTGHEFKPNDIKYLDTFQQGSFVWHLFETSPS